MNNHMQDGMAEATRLTREGRLAEATALIQRTLGGSLGGKFGSPASSDGPDGADGPIEASSRVMDEAPRPAAPSQPGPAEHTLRPAPRPPRGFRGTPRSPGGLPGAPARPTEGAPAVVPAGGRFVERSYTNQAGTRAYKLYVPSGYVGQAVPLVVMLHGCTQNPDDFSAGTHMNALAEERTFLVAYPAQAQNDNMSRCWNWFKAADQQRGRGEPSIIAGITREVVGEYALDSGRVYVAGMSAGGAMAAIMGTAYPDLYAAMGVHSGLAPGAAHDLLSAFAAMQNGGPCRDAPILASNRVTPAIVFHGDRDTTVHPRNGDQLLAHLAASTGDRNLAGKPAPRAKIRQGQVPGGHAYTCATYHDADGRAVVERWTIHGLGHAWSGGGLSGSYTDPKGPDASAEMVRFFLQHPRRELTG
ncbi:PHB depolymerase family esterase [soil metagenome]|jgi:poly(hydroxyalkanoate) depolymerase family esterase